MTPGGALRAALLAPWLAVAGAPAAAQEHDLAAAAESVLDEAGGAFIDLGRATVRAEPAGPGRYRLAVTGLLPDDPSLEFGAPVLLLLTEEGEGYRFALDSPAETAAFRMQTLSGLWWPQSGEFPELELRLEGREGEGADPGTSIGSLTLLHRLESSAEGGLRQAHSGTLRGLRTTSDYVDIEIAALDWESEAGSRSADTDVLPLGLLSAVVDAAAFGKLDQARRLQPALAALLDPQAGFAYRWQVQGAAFELFGFHTEFTEASLSVRLEPAHGAYTISSLGTLQGLRSTEPYLALWGRLQPEALQLSLRLDGIPEPTIPAVITGLAYELGHVLWSREGPFSPAWLALWGELGEAGATLTLDRATATAPAGRLEANAHLAPAGPPLLASGDAFVQVEPAGGLLAAAEALDPRIAELVVPRISALLALGEPAVEADQRRRYRFALQPGGSLLLNDRPLPPAP